MSKNFKRCPRCNYKTLIQLKKCGSCGLNYDKFNSATNAEAKSAFRMGEKQRVLYTKKIPDDVDKGGIFFSCLLGGWFGLHHFKLGRIWRGFTQVLGFIFSLVYSYSMVNFNIGLGYDRYFLLLLGLVWVFSFITWISDSFAILFNRFKYPVSLPYSYKATKNQIASGGSSEVVVESTQDQNKENKPDNTQSSSDNKIKTESDQEKSDDINSK